MLAARFLAFASVPAVLLAATVALAQPFPSKTVRIVTTGVGGGNDFASRIIAQGISGPLGQPVIVENRGGSIINAAGVVAKAPPDGYTILYTSSSVWLLPFLQDDVPYDVLRDFSPITLAVTSPNILVVHPSLPVRSVKDLVALARARPGELNYSSGVAGSSTHLTGELFKAVAKVNIVNIPYKNTSTETADLLGGQVQLAFGAPGTLLPHVKAGKLRALAVTSARPSALVPDLPTIASSGVPGYEWATITGVFAPARTPDDIIQRLNQEIVRRLNEPEIKSKFLNAGAETVGSSPEQLAAKVKSEMARMGKVIKAAGIRAQ